MIKKNINLDVKITNKQGRLVEYTVTVDGAARFGALETSVKNALYGQHDLHSANIFSITYNVRANKHAALVDVGA